ncbi:hypothetical protein EA472_06955 [Natrarchaeobius oligotrophus]|uniref:Uncharacterized protein n=1 Tax=Natrarchaeobius chitinivorans TaxID=1679083 RepID=A0A3N6NNP8_NATCH|nr:hypothetical protein EA472_06955 [Natrarchaeobius chitinivorans]
MSTRARGDGSKERGLIYEGATKRGMIDAAARTEDERADEVAERTHGTAERTRGMDNVYARATHARA